MKRYIKSTSYRNIIIEDKIFINIDVDIHSPIAAATDAISRFPGVDQFRKDMVNILESEYHFDVIEDNYGGYLQKGYVSNRDNSISIYFDTYFDLSEAKPAVDRLGISSLKLPDAGVVYCFIHVRFSDHILNDMGDVAHENFLKNNANKYVARNPKVTTRYEEEDFTVDERMMQLYYDEALELLRNQLDNRIVGWVKNANIINKRINK